MPRNLLVLLMALFMTCPLWAAPADWVRDGAGALSTEKQAYLETLLEQVKQQTSAEVMVITVPSLNGQDVDSFATTMFNQIGIGDRTRNNGLLFLIAPNERRTRIEVGYGLESFITDDFAGHILDSYVIPHFRAGNMEAGIVAGTEAIVQVLQGNPQAARGVPGSAPLFASTRLGDLRWTLGALIGVGVLQFVLYFLVGRIRRYPVLLMYGVNALVLGLIVFAVIAWNAFGHFDQASAFLAVGSGMTLTISSFLNLRRFRRYRPRACTHCSGPMRLLSELEDDEKLNAIQKLEESLGSVDYDVWVCPACLKSDTERYVAMSSGYRVCKKCSGHTLKETCTILIAATYSHGGKERYDGRCANCNHQTSRVESTPRLTQSSSSSSSGGGGGGSSSGGGSSGGGGSSRSW